MFVLWFFLAFLGFWLVFAGLYFGLAYLLKIIPANRHFASDYQGIPVWIVSTGAHTDLVMPIQTPEIDWSAFVDTSRFAPNQARYISIGWGDKGFYLETPAWSELKPQVAFKALFKLSQSCLQVVLYDEIPQSVKWKSQVFLNKTQYQQLVNYIQKTFECDERGQIIHIPFAGMPAYEHLNYNFYEGEGQYHLFKTCNCWANNALKTAGVKTSVWTPFAKSVFYHLPKG
ncbi:MAG: TIGR02117 family protein [Microscillaceae bacterium]|jgi:uncharacterized protein (TIGR02117 family)|nr:TIGR02117 family protein [Microscillaceae bacterium]